MYRYPHVGISTSTCAGSCSSHSRCILPIGCRYPALTPVVGVVVPMQPTIVGPCAGVSVEGSVRIGRGGKPAAP
jgi:hypothetical protein